MPKHRYEEREAAAKIALRHAREEYASLKLEMIQKDDSNRKQSFELNTRIETLTQMLEKQETRMKSIEGTLQAKKEDTTTLNNNESTMMMSFGVEESRFEEGQCDESITGIAEMARATASQLAHAIGHWGKEVEHKKGDTIHDDDDVSMSPTDDRSYKTIVDEISRLEKNLLSRLSR